MKKILSHFFQHAKGNQALRQTKVFWHEVEDSRQISGIGHGNDLLHKDTVERNQPIAFLEGFDWYLGTSGPSNAFILKAHGLDPRLASTNREGIVRETRETIVDYLAEDRHLLLGEIGDKVSIIVNA
jgi:hypothetical protein